MPSETKVTVLAAASALMLQRGFAATSIADICAAAHVAKGTFFHHFPDKETLGVEVLGFYRMQTAEAMAGASFVAMVDPLDRTLAYIDFLAEMLARPGVANSCLLGNLAQEVASENEAIRAACEEGLGGWANEIAADLAAARLVHRATVDFSPESVGRYVVVVFEGSLVLSKALGERTVIRESLLHLRAYIASLFERNERVDWRIASETPAPAAPVSYP